MNKTLLKTVDVSKRDMTKAAVLKKRCFGFAAVLVLSPLLYAFSLDSSPQSTSLQVTGLRVGSSVPKILPIFDGETTDEISCKMVTQREFSSPWFLESIGLIGEKPRNNRKQWEVAYVLHVVKTLNLCEPGKRGLVLAVGTEKLPQVFASMGCSILATDLPVDDDPAFAKAWANTGQHVATIESLYRKNYKGVSKKTFKELVTYHPENMNSFSDWLLQQEKFDFIWSLCSIEHVGSIELGQNVVLHTLDLLKPGGVAFHSVEFNLSSNNATKQMKGESVWRKRDFEALKEKAIAKGYSPFPAQFGAGHGILDRNPDGVLPRPYSSSDHIKLYEVLPPLDAPIPESLIKTSYAMLIRKP
ncbi:Inherit from proNOG: Methyltransferase domain [Seminavis robusta]|uniref:Inherit from proNOG: Methyltransferase domain n=1 Tax=Seminavis robusta TaxID=568900 RepID=A0A9N8EU65_9STRA|nr:Inherit from proNOG: Methyltransferase domain [Seminavis robusta]|eukprot:Sro1890_g303680.1 Inherit from proNOG: Methyltransferase domain (358) ;mRNA; r:6015-7088